MAYLVREEHLQDVSDYLRKHLPDSFLVYTVVKRIMNGLHPGFHVWSSTSLGSSCYNVIVVSADPAKCQNPFYRCMVHLFCADPIDIVKTLSSPGVINCNEERIFLYGIVERDLPYITSMEMFKQYELVMSANSYQYMCYDIQNTSQNVCLDGLTVSGITSDILKTVAEQHWGNSMEGVVNAHEDWMNWKLPTICLYNEDNKPVAWERMSFWGDIGSLFVIESYRKKGIGKYVVCSLAKQIIEKEGFAMSYIEDFNSLSVYVHEAVGFKKNEKVKLNWVVYSHK